MISPSFKSQFLALLVLPLSIYGGSTINSCVNKEQIQQLAINKSSSPSCTEKLLAGAAVTTGAVAAKIAMAGAVAIAPAAVTAASGSTTVAGSLLTIKAVALAVVASPVTMPVVAIGAASYGGYKAYRYYYPTPEEIASAKKIQLALVNSELEIARAQAKRDKLKRETEFKEELIRNINSKKNAQGIPLACQEEAVNLAIVAGSKCVEEIVSDIQHHAPQVAFA